jgi:hypothetical protein
LCREGRGQLEEEEEEEEEGDIKEEGQGYVPGYTTCRQSKGVGVKEEEEVDEETSKSEPAVAAGTAEGVLADDYDDGGSGGGGGDGGCGGWCGGGEGDADGERQGWGEMRKDAAEDKEEASGSPAAMAAAVAVGGPEGTLTYADGNNGEDGSGVGGGERSDSNDQQRRGRRSQKPRRIKKKRPGIGGSGVVTVTSSFGVERRLSPVTLAVAIVEALSTLRLLIDARAAPGDSGVVHLTTRASYEAKRARGLLRCRLCGKFVAGDRALWWHQKTRHGVDHTTAIAAVADEMRALSTNVRPATGSTSYWPMGATSALLSQSAAAGSAAASPTAHAHAHATAATDLSSSAELAPAGQSEAAIPPRDWPPATKDARDLAAGMAAARAGDAAVLTALVAAGRVEALVDPGLDAARRGDVHALRRLALARGGQRAIASAADRHGSGALLWAAGGGHLSACRFLVEEAGIDPKATAQVGRRAYHGRTALHWAARNGHLDVVRYLVAERGMDVDARTAEGTTAFAWACWQGHVATMRWLVQSGGCSFGAVNTFGCNAAMWCVQGRGVRSSLVDGYQPSGSQPISSGKSGGDGGDGGGGGLEACEYIHSLGVTFRLLNANGHSAVHKAAQRGRRDVCAWLLGWRGIECIGGGVISSDQDGGGVESRDEDEDGNGGKDGGVGVGTTHDQAEGGVGDVGSPKP